MAKKPEPQDKKPDVTKPEGADAQSPATEIGATQSATETASSGQAQGTQTNTDRVVKREPEDGVALSDAARAAVEAGKSPQDQIMVVGPKGGRWRAGRHFGPEPTIINVDDLTEEQGLALISDPELVVGPAFPSAAS